KRRGDALIEMESEQDVQKALEKHRMYMGQRYVEVYEINNEDVDALMKSLQVKSSPVVNDGVVRLRGLPYSCNEKDIVDFFADTSRYFQAEGMKFEHMLVLIRERKSHLFLLLSI
ncbi:GRSF1 isoform 7, partial [Pongo abelii]